MTAVHPRPASTTDASAPLLLADARLPGRAGPVDVRIDGGVVSEVAPAGMGSLTPAHRRVGLDGRWLILGLYDRHVHFSQWAMSTRRLDLAGAGSAAAAAALVAASVARG
nr:amidohydrolase [Actinomycetota bacterium]